MIFVISRYYCTLNIRQPTSTHGQTLCIFTIIFLKIRYLMKTYNYSCEFYKKHIFVKYVGIVG